VSASTLSSGATCRFGVQFLDDAGGQTGYGTIGELTAGLNSRVKTATIVAPAGTVAARLDAYIGSVTVGDIFKISDVWIERSSLLNGSSGAQLGGVRNQAMVTIGNVAAVWTGLTLSWTATTISATLTASSATLQAGNDAIPYSGNSVTVSGSPGTSKIFYLYREDPNYEGGSKSLVATATYSNTVNGNGKVYVGWIKVDFPSSGTGGGSRPGGDCVHELAWVVRRNGAGRPERVRARDVVAGRDWLLQTDGTWRLVTIADRCRAPIVRAHFDCGHSLTCSRSAPLERGYGRGFVSAHVSLGATITYQNGGNAAEVVAVEDLGMGWVMHFYLADGSFLAGDDPDHLFGHHNIKNNVP
jgi:hypothetical protein